MASFDFSTLNSTDFENLVGDLLNAQERCRNSHIRFKSFKTGKDKGIDLLHASQGNPYEIIVQAKHFVETPYSVFFSHLKLEKEKVERLKPCTYILATSKDLTVAQTEGIVDLFEPFIRTQNDIYGKKNLNALLDEYPNILNNHYKLWFSSTAVLQKLSNYIHAGKAGEFVENNLKKKLRLYVATPQLNEARSIIEKNSFVVVTGEPGSGKTSLAELLLYEHIANDYGLIYITDTLHQVENLITPDDTKQIFYFDDFLGHTESELVKARASESYLLNIIRRISWNKNKRLILTTRTFILNSALLESEKLKGVLTQAIESTVSLQEYSPALRRQLILNHVEESLLSENLKGVLREESMIDYLIDHPNFYPRSVQFMTTHENVGQFNAAEYKKFVFDNFDKPDQIWRHAYEHQINNQDRFLLNTLLSFGYSTTVNSLEQAFLARIDYEVAYHNFPRPMQAFRNSFQRLLKGFITFEQQDSTSQSEKEVCFINPSLVDFLVQYLQEDKNEVVRIAESARFAEQLTTRLYKLRSKPAEYLLPDRLREKLISQPSLFFPSNSDLGRLEVAMILYKYDGSKEGRNAAFNLLAEIVCWDDFTPQYDSFLYFSECLKTSKDTDFINHIKSLGPKVFAPVIWYLNDVTEIKKWEWIMQTKYELVLSDLIQQQPQVAWDRNFTEVLDVEISRMIGELDKFDYDEENLEACKRKAMRVRNYLGNLGATPTLSSHLFDRYEERFDT